MNVPERRGPLFPFDSPSRFCQAAFLMRGLTVGRTLLRRQLSILILLKVWLLTLPIFAGTTNSPAPKPLPSGFLNTRGCQIVGPDGGAVRIASVGLTGMNVVGGRLELVGPFK